MFISKALTQQAPRVGMQIMTQQQLSLVQMASFAWIPKQKPLKEWHIVRDDFVQVLNGKYKNQRGQVLKVFRDRNQVVVKGVNLKYMTVDDDEGSRQKKVVQKEHPIHISNVGLLDPEQE